MLDAAKKPKAEAVQKVEAVPEDPFKVVLNKAGATSAILGSMLGFGCLCPDPAFLSMFSIFSLALVAGY